MKCPLLPTAFLDRSATVYADRPAVIDGEFVATYAQLRSRALRLARHLGDVGVQGGDRVAVLAPNGHELLEAHYGLPYAGVVLVTLNVRLAPGELAVIVEHSGARLLLTHPTFVAAAEEIATRVPGVRVVVFDDAYEAAVTSGDRATPVSSDEDDLLALNYTSGTTGAPKGVMYHHRGAYLQALAMVVDQNLGNDSRYLWTLPMFHCNGWCFTWAVTAAGGVHVCLPRPDPDQAWALLRQQRISHLCAAPTVVTALLESDRAAPLSQPVRVALGGAPPTPTLIDRCERLGLDVSHLYGLTETFGPAAVCEWQPEWDRRDETTRMRLRARQGVGNIVTDGWRVVTGDGHDVAADGSQIGEIVLRSNTVMTGYYKDPAGTAEALDGGWFHTGDLGVMHPDGYIELCDRAKDIIISGGENISSVEIEAALSSHPAVLEAAVVARPHPRWGERPVAWVCLRNHHEANEDELKAHVRARLAGFKVPDEVRFGDLPRNGTGKIEKFRLRTFVDRTTPT